MSFLIWLVFRYLNNMQSNHQEGIRYPVGTMESQQTPLLSCKDDDLTSWGSYDGLSQDDEYNEDGLGLTASQGRHVKDGEYNSNICRLCAICFDAPRDCFFLPCGHHASCFECGTRYAPPLSKNYKCFLFELNSRGMTNYLQENMVIFIYACK